MDPEESLESRGAYDFALCLSLTPGTTNAAITAIPTTLLMIPRDTPSHCVPFLGESPQDRDSGPVSIQGMTPSSSLVDPDLANGGRVCGMGGPRLRPHGSHAHGGSPATVCVHMCVYAHMYVQSGLLLLHKQGC
ncbi:hypothetical protein KIL84_007748 [Mauremys mutica]|uniref:Uncharacterized protein n=1 Tax=Mauremys mutica TaxID=74926 RepID=A0A9D3X3Z3_9SAUR|nr:hypothetical protein KIL84_007748 [Mauremys mutica]